VLVLVNVGVVGWLVWPRPEPPRARPYLAFTACLLTDEEGITGAAAPVWAGMQEASLATRAKVQYLAVDGPSTVENVTPFLASLVQRRCDVVVAVGPAEVAAAQAAAGRASTTKFVLVSGAPSTPKLNVTVVASQPADQVTVAVRDAIVAAVRASGGR
jgi:basic membrane lipoprotein Med (substrate-binding protein (PBP1-ABC) superfamily)